MTISSRTPEGSPGKCPICDNDICIEPSLPYGDAPCPNCGALLWFLNLSGETRCFDSAETAQFRQRVLDGIADQLELDALTRAKLQADPAILRQLGADSLDLVEIVMELEEELP